MSEPGTEEVVDSPEVTFEPIVTLPAVEINKLEENETECFKMRAKLFRFASESDPPEWKERGIGEVRLLKHKSSKRVRLLMRRDKTHKICANHYLTKEMTLLPSAGSDRAWVWTVLADFADEEPKMEQLAIRLKNAENAQKFKTAFEECQRSLEDEEQNEEKDKEEDLSQDMMKLTVTQEKKEEGEKQNDAESNSGTAEQTQTSKQPQPDSKESKDDGSDSKQDTAKKEDSAENEAA